MATPKPATMATVAGRSRATCSAEEALVPVRSITCWRTKSRRSFSALSALRVARESDVGAFDPPWRKIGEDQCLTHFVEVEFTTGGTQNQIDRC